MNQLEIELTNYIKELEEQIYHAERDLAKTSLISRQKIVIDGVKHQCADTVYRLLSILRDVETEGGE